MTEEEARTKLFNLRLQEKTLKMEGLRQTTKEAQEAYLEELANVQNEIKILRREIARMKFEQVMEEKQGGMKR